MKNENDFYDSIFNRTGQLIESLDKIYEKRGVYLKLPNAKDVPKLSPLITLDLELSRFCTDRSDVIGYKDATSMHETFLGWARMMVTPEMHEMVRNGEILSLTLRLGPRTLSGFNLSGEIGI